MRVRITRNTEKPKLKYATLPKYRSSKTAVYILWLGPFFIYAIPERKMWQG